MAIKVGRPIEMRDAPRRQGALTSTSLDLAIRPRRNRKAEWARRLVRENVLTADDLIWPLFELARKLGCQITRKGAIRCGQYEATSVPGVFVAGNLIKDVQLAIVAAAEGTRAAFGINRSLTREDFERRATGVQQVEHPAVDDKDVARRRPT